MIKKVISEIYSDHLIFEFDYFEDLERCLFASIQF